MNCCRHILLLLLLSFCCARGQVFAGTSSSRLNDDQTLARIYEFSASNENSRCDDFRIVVKKTKRKSRGTPTSRVYIIAQVDALPIQHWSAIDQGTETSVRVFSSITGRNADRGPPAFLLS